MKIDLDPDRMEEMLDTWRKSVDLQIPMMDDFKIRMMKNRREILENFLQTGTGWTLMPRGCCEPGKGARSVEKGCSARRAAPLRLGVCASGATPQCVPSRPNPPGSPDNRPPAVLQLLAVEPPRRVAAPSIRPVLGAARPLPWFTTPSNCMEPLDDAERFDDIRIKVKAFVDWAASELDTLNAMR